MAVVKLPYVVVKYKRLPDGELQWDTSIKFFNNWEDAHKLWKELSFKDIDDCSIMYKIEMDL